MTPMIQTIDHQADIKQVELVIHGRPVPILLYMNPMLIDPITGEQTRWTFIRDAQSWNILFAFKDTKNMTYVYYYAVDIGTNYCSGRPMYSEPGPEQMWERLCETRLPEMYAASESNSGLELKIPIHAFF